MCGQKMSKGQKMAMSTLLGFVMAAFGFETWLPPAGVHVNSPLMHRDRRGPRWPAGDPRVKAETLVSRLAIQSHEEATQSARHSLRERSAAPPRPVEHCTPLCPRRATVCVASSLVARSAPVSRCIPIDSSAAISRPPAAIGAQTADEIRLRCTAARRHAAAGVYTVQLTSRTCPFLSR